MGKFLDENSSTAKRLWSYIKSQRKDHCGVAPLKFNGDVHNNSLAKAQILNTYFQSVFTPTLSSTPTSMERSYIPDIESIHVDSSGVVELLKNLKPHKASRPNEIPAYLLKETSEEIAPALTFIF